MGKALVAIADSVFPNLDPTLEVLSKIGAELSLAKEPTPAATLQVAKDADAVMVTYAKISAEMIQQMRRCRIIARFGIGIDNVDIPAATRCGIVVTRVPDYCIEEVADHTMALLLALARKITVANGRSHAGQWELSTVAPIRRLRGRTLGLVGFGKIPQLVTPKAHAFGLKVVTYDPYVSREITAKAGVEPVDFDELIKISDFISVHTPLLPETHHLFNADVFRQMKPDAYLINTARGSIVDEIALTRALDAGQLAGAALDVLEQEPPTHSPPFGRGNVILTPHMGFYSLESLVELQTKAAEEVVRVLSGREPRNPVNLEALQSKQEVNARA